MRRFYMSDIPVDGPFLLPEEESKHIVRVLRMLPGDRFLLLNGNGLLVTVEITDAHPKRCQVKVIERIQKERPANGFHLAIAPTKNLDRMEWMVEKMVEVGAARLTFIQCDHSERVNLKTERLLRVAISAMKQSEQDFLLEMDDLQSFREFIASNEGGCIAHCMDGDRKSVSQALNSNRILIGPEGDFSPEELELALKNGYEAIHLGESRLRTETAGLVATVLAITAKI